MLYIPSPHFRNPRAAFFHHTRTASIHTETKNMRRRNHHETSPPTSQDAPPTRDRSWYPPTADILSPAHDFEPACLPDEGCKHFELEREKRASHTVVFSFFVLRQSMTILSYYW